MLKSSMETRIEFVKSSKWITQKQRNKLIAGIKKEYENMEN